MTLLSSGLPLVMSFGTNRSGTPNSFLRVSKAHCSCSSGGAFTSGAPLVWNNKQRLVKKFQRKPFEKWYHLRGRLGGGVLFYLGPRIGWDRLYILSRGKLTRFENGYRSFLEEKVYVGLHRESYKIQVIVVRWIRGREGGERYLQWCLLRPSSPPRKSVNWSNNLLWGELLTV